jgi:hypothetical protein
MVSAARREVVQELVGTAVQAAFCTVAHGPHVQGSGVSPDANEAAA